MLVTIEEEDYYFGFKGEKINRCNIITLYTNTVLLL